MEKSEIETIYRKYFHDVFLYIRALSENESLARTVISAFVARLQTK